MSMSHDIDLSALERFSFGDGEGLADELLDLVLAGRKTATCWSWNEVCETHVGKRMIACDGRGVPRAVIETVSLEARPFDRVDEAFARLEGEGDLTLAWWRQAHRDYFTRNGGFAPDMMLWLEVFQVVARL
ncbi:MAG: ASCH domain-containing protein [Caulobacter sp.]|nr:ASCH domain-containing protein [Caulobacter sp.]